jgi:H+/Cl- antiporter ClcA
VYNFESFTSYEPTAHSKRSQFTSLPVLIIFVLTLVAVLTACVACFIDFIAYNIIKYKKHFVYDIEDYSLGCFVWISASLFFICCAASFGDFIAPEANGSGIPEVKCILSGVEMPGYLAGKTLFCKIFALIFCSASLSIGKEGPHIHLSAMVAHQVLNLKIFSSLKQHPGVITRIMESSVSAGVAAVMAAPIGSIFFSMELTATFYMINNLTLSLYCGILCSFFILLYRTLGLSEIVNSTDIPSDYNNYDLVLFGFIGVIAGILGVIFTSITSFLVRCRSEKKVSWLHKRYRYAITITFIYSFITYVIPFMMISSRETLNQLFSTNPLPSEWKYFGMTGSLFAFCLLKLLSTAASTSVQIPGGVFLPAMMIGGAVGRLVSELTGDFGGIGDAAMYSAIGAASLVSSTTHCLSICLIIFEMTGQMNYVVPMLFSVVISYNIGSSLGLNIFDAMIVMKKIPYLPAVRKTKLYRTYAHEIMGNPVKLYENSDNRQLRDAIFNDKVHKIVIVDSDNYILADFPIENAREYLTHCLEGYKSSLDKEVIDLITRNIDNKDFMEIELESEDPFDLRISEEGFNSFWATPVDFTSYLFEPNRHPITLDVNTPLSKIHYFFLMLGLMQVYLVKDFKLEGVVYRHYFTDSKK